LRFVGLSFVSFEPRHTRRIFPVRQLLVLVQRGKSGGEDMEAQRWRERERERERERRLVEMDRRKDGWMDEE
jgi:hypothetical protein